MDQLIAAWLTPTGLSPIFLGITSILTTINYFYIRRRIEGKYSLIIKSLNASDIFDSNAKRQDKKRKLVVNLLDLGEILTPSIKEKMFFMFVFRLLGIFSLYVAMDINVEGKLFEFDTNFEAVDTVFLLGQLVLSSLNNTNPMLSKDEKAFLLNMAALKVFYYDEIISHYLNDINTQVDAFPEIQGKRKELLDQAKELTKKFDSMFRKKLSSESFWKKLFQKKKEH